MSKHTSLNNNGQQENKYDQYHPIDVAWEVAGTYQPKDWGFHSKPPKLSLFSGEEVPGKHEISFNR